MRYHAPGVDTAYWWVMIGRWPAYWASVAACRVLKKSVDVVQSGVGEVPGDGLWALTVVAG